MDIHRDSFGRGSRTGNAAVLLTGLMALLSGCRTVTVHGVLPTPPDADEAVVVYASSESGTLLSPGQTHVVRRTPGGLTPKFLVVGIGHKLRFENEDNLCHRYFTACKDREFDSGILHPTECHNVRFTQPGLVTVHCSLHSDEWVRVLVLPSSHHSLVRADGAFTLNGLTTGEYDVRVWSKDGDRHYRRLQVLRDRTRFLDAPTGAPPR